MNYEEIAVRRSQHVHEKHCTDWCDDTDFFGWDGSSRVRLFEVSSLLRRRISCRLGLLRDIQ